MNELTKQKNLVVGLLTSPWSILVSVAIAALIGVMFKDVAAVLRPFGQMYLYMIEMTVIPIIVSAVISSVAGLAKSAGVRAFLVRMIVVFVLMLVGVALLGTLAGIIGKPGAGLDEQTRNTLGAIVKTQQSQYAPDLELSLSAPIERKPQASIVDFLVQMVPRNIFESLSSGSALELIFFSIIFGIAVGVLGARRGSSLIEVFDGLFKAFQKIISWLMVILPFGLICLLSWQIASTGLQILLAMMKFILVFFAVGIALFLVDVAIIWRRSRLTLGRTLKAILDPVVVSLVTRSSFATLPSAIRSLTQKLGFFERSTNLFFSLGTTLGRFGNILYFSIASIFVAQLYGAQLDLTQYGIVAIGSLFAGIATAGASGIATLNLLAIVLTPLRLPIEAVLVIFIAIDTIADPLRTMLIVVTNMAANTLIVPRVDTFNRRTEEGRRPGVLEEATDLDFTSHIAGKAELVVALADRDSPPFYAEGSDGAMEGLAVDYAKALAERLGVPLTFNRRATTASEVVQMLRENQADIALTICNAHKLFGSELAWSRPYLATREAMLADKSRLNKLRGGDNLLSSLKSYPGKVGVVGGSVHEQVAARMFPRAAITSYADCDELVDAVFGADVLAAFGNELELKAALAKRPSRESRMSVIGFGNLPADFRFGVAPRYGDSLPLIDEVIAAKQENPAATS